MSKILIGVRVSTESTSRKAFLDRVRTAAVAGRAHRVGSDDRAGDVGYVGADAELCGALAAEVEAVGGQSQVLQSDDEVRRAVEKLLTELSAKKVICWQHSLLERLGLSGLLNNQRIEHDDFDTLAMLPPEERRQKILQAEVGISSVDYAVAETGSLVVCSRPGQERVVSLVPAVHIAIVEESQIVPDLFDIFAKLESIGLDKLPSNLAFISGPSKTGDIELQLTTGVHGPGHWHVLILRAA